MFISKNLDKALALKSKWFKSILNDRQIIYKYGNCKVSIKQ